MVFFLLFLLIIMWNEGAVLNSSILGAGFLLFSLNILWRAAYKSGDVTVCIGTAVSTESSTAGRYRYLAWLGTGIVVTTQLIVVNHDYDDD